MDVTLLPADTYIVVNKTILSDEYRKILNILYQPIVGSTSINLYFTFWANLDRLELKSCEKTHNNLANSMQLSINEIKESRKKLEAVGLLKTYIKKETVNKYIYELYSPLSANNFLNHPILNITLYNIVGKKEYNDILEYFKIDNYDISEYKDISVSFSDIFKSSNSKSMVTNNTDIKKCRINDLKINTNIDFDLIISSLPNSSINKYTFNNEVKNLIIKLAFVYDLDNLQIVDIIRASLHEKGIIDKVKLRKNARNYYQFEHNGNLPNLINVTQPDELKSKINDNSSESKMIYTFDNTKPYDFLKSKQNGALPTSRDLKILETLAVDYELNPGIINVLIDYVLKVNDNKLNKGFIDTIAGEWKRRKIEKVTDAVKVAREEYKKHLEYNKVKEGKKIINEKQTPEWFDKTITKTDASEDETKEMDELLKEFR